MVSDKLDPKFSGKNKIVKEKQSGNYQMANDKGKILAYPRWKLKEIKDDRYPKITERDLISWITRKLTLR